ncbi:hypothetical protein [Prosthecobacter sp.]|uniref:hypothetical protein n=1 Tax=Prosthecobacter sp. TaxID=1965333 RepID=UPI0024880A66|nr:hypothetical protein [Prosthecobacter sp.]MDI1311798.1 hypothetical protein [Prosthecobacter sp.]
MNPKRTIVILLTAFAAIWITDLLIHQLAMKTAYMKIAGLWRTPDGMRALIKWIMVGQFMAAGGLTVIWINRCAPNTTTLKSAVRFGFFVGLIATSYAPMFYAVLPIPGLICLQWALYGILQSIVVTVVVYLTTYKLSQEG